MAGRSKPTALDGGLQAGITPENYGERAKAFVAANDDKGFIIALKNGERNGAAYSQTLPQWGAWLAFFRRKGIGHAYMLQVEFYTVPAEWPSLFTTDSTAFEDHEAGATFDRRWFDALADPPLRGSPPKPDKPRTLFDARKVRPAPRNLPPSLDEVT